MDPLTPTPPSLPSLPGQPVDPAAPGQSPPPPVDPTAQDQPTPEVTSAAPSVKQQIVEQIKNSKNVLVTVRNNPSVDELASALGLTLLLGKLDKHATAVFSGKVPPAIEFLDPDKTFENTVDSLRDFIIALDKQKADKLRYKVEDEVVKIFITPYKTVINEKDLEFSQGDYNVDAVIALGVDKQEEFDQAITAHGRILHDATVITINTGAEVSKLGSLDWNESESSSIAEMLVSITEAFGREMLDEQISTALLTGIVAETNRFSNEKTTPKVMTMAAQLMATGANQQLIATNLRQEGMLSESVRTKKTDQPHDDNGEIVLAHDQPDEEVSTSDKNSTKKSSQPKAKQAKEASEPEEAETAKPPEPPEEPSETSTPIEVTSPEPETSSPEPEPPVEEETPPTQETTEQPSAETEQAPLPEAPVSEPPLPPLPGTEPPAADESTTSDTSSESPAPEETPSEPAVAEDTTLPPIVPSHPPQAQAQTPTLGGTLNSTSSNDEDGLTTPVPTEVDPAPPIMEHQATDAIDAARKAVEDAAVNLPFNPANQPLEAVNSTPVHLDDPSMASEGAPSPDAAPNNTVEDSPVDAFMQPYAPPAPLDMPPPMSSFPTPTTPQPSTDNNLPPLPPMPTIPTTSGMPPLPPIPGQPADPMATMQPQLTPQFMQDTPQSQNPWTNAGDDQAAKNAQAEADRQAKIDSRVADFESAVDKNRELRGEPPLNDPKANIFPTPPTSL